MIEDNLKATPELSIFIFEILQKSALSEDAKLLDIREVLLSTGVFMSGDGELLYRLDRSITLTRAELGDRHPAVLGLTATYHNLLRKWAQL